MFIGLCKFSNAFCDNLVQLTSTRMSPGPELDPKATSLVMASGAVWNWAWGTVSPTRRRQTNRAKWTETKLDGQLSGHGAPTEPTERPSLCTSRDQNFPLETVHLETAWQGCPKTKPESQVHRDYDMQSSRQKEASCSDSTVRASFHGRKNHQRCLVKLQTWGHKPFGKRNLKSNLTQWHLNAWSIHGRVEKQPACWFSTQGNSVGEY